MDIYQIWTTYNKKWSKYEILAFSVILLLIVIIMAYRGITEVYVYGHSLGEVDMPYFKEIKRHIVKNAAWYFYVLCKKEELKEKKAELLKKIECLHIKRQYIHIYTVDKFLI